MPLWEILLLAVVQGVTEFLPISSSGHLVIVGALLGTEADLLEVNVTLHAGTLLSIVVFYWRRLWRLVGEDRRVIGLLLVGTLPAGALGVLLELFAEELLENALLAGCMLVATGGILLITARFVARPGGLGADGYQQMSPGKSLLIGVSQAAAILPGISRSGATICAGLSLGLAPQSAATFSFLLAVPVIAGATLLKLIQGLGDGVASSTPPFYLAAGAGASFAVGLLSLWWLVRWLERGRLQLFAWWCIPVGLAVVVWRLTGWPMSS